MARLWSPLRRALRKVPPQILLIALVLLAALASALFSMRAKPGEPPAETPQSAPAPVSDDESTALSNPIENAFEAARTGDLDRYLAQFADPLRAQLLRIRTDQGDPALRKYLMRLTAPIKGVAVDLTRREPTGPAEVQLLVAFVYSDHNETQSFRLRSDGDAWHIVRIDQVRSAPILIPYGTPVEQIPAYRH